MAHVRGGIGTRRKSIAALVTVAGVLVEVPGMLSLVAVANRTRHWFPQEEAPIRTSRK